MDNREHADDLLRRALLDKEATAAVALRVAGLPLCEQLTVVFHGRRDLGTIQTYVAHGGRWGKCPTARGGWTAASRSTSSCPRTASCPPRWSRPRSGSWSPPCAAPARSPRAGRRWGSCARSR